MAEATCGVCGWQVVGDARFCRECGTEIAAAPDAAAETPAGDLVDGESAGLFEAVCVECGWVIEDGAQFCGNCGIRLGSPPDDPLPGVAPGASSGAAAGAAVGVSATGAAESEPAASDTDPGPVAPPTEPEPVAPATEPVPVASSVAAGSGPVGGQASPPLPDDAAPVLFDQESKPAPSRTLIIVGVGVALLLLIGGLFVITSGDDGDDTAAPPTLESIAPQTVAPTPAPTLPPTTLPATTVPPTAAPTTVPPTTVPPTTVPPTTVPPTTIPPTTVPPTTVAPTTAPPTTVAPKIWDLPSPPPLPLPESGPGTPLIAAASLPSGVLAENVEPFLLRAQGLVDALAAGEWNLVRSIDASATATDAEFAVFFALLDRSSLILLDALVVGNSYEMAVVEVNYNSTESQTVLRCIQYVSDGVTGQTSRRGGFAITTIAGNVSPEAVRLDTATFDEVSARCTFPALAGALAADESTP